MRERRCGEVAKLFGRTPNWLRDLEKRGIIPPAPRDFAGYRQYSLEDIETIRKIVTSRRRNGGAMAA